VLADPYDAILLDLDGVLYRWPEPISGAAGAVATLRAGGKRIAFVTNNSSRTPEQVVDRLVAAGVEAAPAEVVTSALATATLLGERGVGSVFVIGEEGLRKALADEGIRIVDGRDDRVDAVVVGFDRSADYAKLRDASVLVGRGAALVASNLDGSFPAPGGESWPGAAAGGGRPLVVGDRLDTDIAGAARLGWDSALVLTGSARREDVDGSSWAPTIVVSDLAALA
jgi:HAD superfamily hydrolase (TIGR01450 family)